MMWTGEIAKISKITGNVGRKTRRSVKIDVLLVYVQINAKNLRGPGENK